VRTLLRGRGLELESRSLRIAASVDMEIVETDISSSSSSSSGGKESVLLRIGDVETIVVPPVDPALVPYTLFFEIPQHKLVLRDMLRDVLTGKI